MDGGEVNRDDQKKYYEHQNQPVTIANVQFEKITYGEVQIQLSNLQNQLKEEGLQGYIYGIGFNIEAEKAIVTVTRVDSGSITLEESQEFDLQHTYHKNLIRLAHIGIGVYFVDDEEK